jgi:uncharacterized repeat protein (TIGR01451 family)
LGITLFTSAPDVHIGDTILYSINVFNGIPNSGRIACDAGSIVAHIVTPDGKTNGVPLLRTLLHQGESDFYPDVVSYVVRAQDLRPDGTVRATAEDQGIIYQNDTPSSGGGFQGVNTEVNLPCILLSVQCVGSVGETGAMLFSGTVTNCGNTKLVGVTVTNLDNNGQFSVQFNTNLNIGQIASFTGTWIPLNACIPSTVTLVAQAIDQFTTTPRVVTSSANAVCQNVLTQGIKVTKACPPQAVAPGQLLTFSGSVSNTGNVTLKNIVVVNDQPSANTPVFTLATLAPGAVAGFTGSYLAPTNCSVTDTLVARAESICGVAVTDTVSATCPIVTSPQIAVTAVCPPTPMVPGGSLTYSGTVRNTGNIPLNNVIVLSDRPAANTTVFSVATLAPGAVAGFTGTYTVPGDVCSLTTTFTGIGKDMCTPNTVTNSVSTTCSIATAPAIAVTLVCPPVSASTGGTITYSGTVSNPGNVTLKNVTVVDNQATPSTVLTLASLAPGASANFNASFTAPADACSVSSTVTATGSDNCSSALVSKNASATCALITAPSIAVTQVCPPSPAIPGGLVSYTGTVKNAGNITLTNVVVLNNLSGATPIFTAATLAPGEVAAFTGSYLAPTNCSTTSISTATGRSICGVEVTGTVSSTCTILTAPQIAVTAVCPTAPVSPGATLTYSGTVRNTGNIPLNDVVVASDRPAANTTVFTVATLAPGASANFTGSYTVPADACSVTTTFSGTGKDICTLNMVTNAVSTTCTVTTTPAIAVTLACPSVPAATGGLITYSGTVSNPGNVTLNNVAVIDNQAAPSTVFTVASLAPGASASFTASFTAPADACSVSSTVTATGSDKCTAKLVSSSASAVCPLITAPSIVITQSCPPNPVSPGGLLTYNAAVRNTGNITLTNVVVTGIGTAGAGAYTISTKFWVDDAVPTGATAKIDGGDLWNWVGANPAPFSGAKALQSGIVTNLHQYVFDFGANTFPITGGDILVAYVNLDTVNTPSEVMIQWYDGNYDHRAYWGANSIELGTNGTASRHYMGALPAPGQWVRLEVPASTVGLEGSMLKGMALTLYGGRATWDAAGVATQIPATPVSTGNTVFTVATLAPGAIADFTASYTVPADNSCSFTSTLSVSAGDMCTGTPVAAHVSNTCPIPTMPAIAVTQACPITPVPQGGILTFTGTVSNTGNSTLTNVVVVNNWPIHNVVVFTVPSLAPGAVKSFTGSYQVPWNCCVAWSTVVATGQDCSGTIVTDTDSGTCQVLTKPAITVSKVCPPGILRPGDLLTYSGSVSNAGNITLINVGLVNSQSGVGNLLPGLITMAPGESIPYTASYIVPPDFCGADTVTASGLDACSYSTVANSATTTCPVLTTPRIVVTQTCPPQKTAHGSLLVYSGTVGNPGNVTLVNVYVVSSQPGNNTPVTGPITLAPGDIVNFTGSYLAPVFCCQTINTLAASGQDRCTGSNVTATATAVCPLLYSPSLVVTPDCPATPVAMGSLFVFSGLVSNSGDAILTNVLVFNSQAGQNLPLLGPIDLAPGESKHYAGSMIVASNICSVVVSATGQETCRGNLITVAGSCPVATTPLLTLTQSCPVALVAPGRLLTYSGTVRNDGNITLNNIVITNDHSGSTPLLTVAVLFPGEFAQFTGSYIAPTEPTTTSTSTATALSLCGTPVMNTASSTCVTPPPPVIGGAGAQPVTYKNGAVSFSFMSESGVTYLIQYKDSLNDPTWTNMGTADGNGGVVNIVHNSTSAKMRFFRVIFAP